MNEFELKYQQLNTLLDELIEMSDGDSNLLSHAKQELKLCGYTPSDEEQEDGPNKWIQENVLQLMKVFSLQEHSGFSAPYCTNLFKELASYKALSPLTGEDDEWYLLGYNDETYYQNKRDSKVFKTKDNKAYYIDGKVFWKWARDEDGRTFKLTFTNKDSSVYIDSFPYTPTTEYVFSPTEEFPNECLNDN